MDSPVFFFSSNVSLSSILYRITSVFLIGYICKSPISICIELATSSSKCEDTARITSLRTGFQAHTVRMAELTQTQKTEAPSTLRLIARTDGRIVEEASCANFYRPRDFNPLLIAIYLIARATLQKKKYEKKERKEEKNTAAVL